MSPFQALAVALGAIGLVVLVQAIYLGLEARRHWEWRLPRAAERYRRRAWIRAGLAVLCLAVALALWLWASSR